MILSSLKGFDAIRARIPPHGERVVVRTGLSQVRPVPGELFTLQVERSWVFGHTRYAKGPITATRLDAPGLELQPLGFEECGVWDPDDEPELFERDAHPVYEAIRMVGPRRWYEMEQVLPEDAVELQWEEDPILEVVELAAVIEAGSSWEAASVP